MLTPLPKRVYTFYRAKELTETVWFTFAVDFDYTQNTNIAQKMQKVVSYPGFKLSKNVRKVEKHTFGYCYTS